MGIQYISTAKGEKLDNLGLLHDIPRLPGETDADYRKRIVDIIIYKRNHEYPWGSERSEANDD